MSGVLLDDMERARLIEHLKMCRLDFWFGDGQEEEYVMTGLPNAKGLMHMTDAELLEEHGHHNAGDSVERMAQIWKKELHDGVDFCDPNWREDKE